MAKRIDETTKQNIIIDKRSGLSTKEIAKRYGVGYSTTMKIIASSKRKKTATPKKQKRLVFTDMSLETPNLSTLNISEPQPKNDQVIVMLVQKDKLSTFVRDFYANS